jgi:2-succinyl-6-hydroxy-2,4-cyclohexadiene-1-carboxylate synthase
MPYFDKYHNLTVNSVEYFVQQTGQGSPLVLLHGFTGSSQNWQPFMSDWAARHQVIAIDLLGHGRSQCPPDPQRYHIEQAAADLVVILAQLDLGTIDLLGYSMGGRLALATAVAAPARINTLILESASPGLETAAERHERCQRDQQLADFIEHEGIAAFVDYWEQVPLFASQQKLPADVQARLRQQRLLNRSEGLANSLRGMGTGQQPSYWSSLADLTMPVLLLTGELDHKFVAINQRMSHLLPNAMLNIVPDAGHTIHLERPLLFGQLVREWLEG